MSGPREAVLDWLSRPGADNRFRLDAFVRDVREAKGWRRHDVLAAVWGLVAEGLVYLDHEDQPSDAWWRWKLSPAGLRAVNGGAWEPTTMDRYLNRLRRDAPALDGIVLQYVEEALRAFNAQCYLAAAVMVGVASERAFLLLAEAFAEAVGEQASALRKELSNPRSSQHRRYAEFRKLVEHRRDRLPNGLVDPIALDGVAELLRVVRNDAGHPTGAEIDEDTARTQLLIAGPYLQKMARLRAHVQGLDAGALAR